MHFLMKSNIFELQLSLICVVERRPGKVVPVLTVFVFYVLWYMGYAMVCVCVCEVVGGEDEGSPFAFLFYSFTMNFTPPAFPALGMARLIQQHSYDAQRNIVDYRQSGVENERVTCPVQVRYYKEKLPPSISVFSSSGQILALSQFISNQ